MISKDFPYYGPLAKGPYNVSLLIKGPSSDISKSIGLESPTAALSPNMDYIKKLAEGNLGIGDKILKNTISKNLKDINKDQFLQFAKMCKIDTSNIDKYQTSIGKYTIDKNDINISSEFDKVGIIALEKTILQSIFETQKPYIEIVKTSIETIAKLEDVIARVMPLLSVLPLKTKSKVPTSNAGNVAKPKSIGYDKTSLTKSLSELETLTPKSEGYEINKAGVAIKKETKATTKTESEQKTKKWRVISTQYSTVYFDPKVDYTYSYINIIDDVKAKETINIDIADEIDPYHKYKPNTIVLGIYDKNGIAFNPDDKLKTIGFDGNNLTQEITPYTKASWIKKSNKWFFENNIIECDSINTPYYMWSNGIKIVESKVKPTESIREWEIIKYKEGDIDLISKESAIVGDLMISKYDDIDIKTYEDYFKDIANEIAKKENIESDISNLDIKEHINNINKYGQIKSSYYKDEFPQYMRKSFKPIKIHSNELSDYIWIDPETDYELKVIKITPSKNIIVNGQSAKINNFVKNLTKFSVEGNQLFTIVINNSKNDTQIIETNITEYNLENWNYDSNRIIDNNIDYWITLYTTDVNNNRIYYLENDIFNLTSKISLPNFAIKRNILLSNKGISYVDDIIPLYNIIVDSEKPGVVLDPSQILNEELTKSESFSKGYYGYGTIDEPQAVETINRYMITDLDTESYYIIEGKLIKDKATNKGNVNSEGNSESGDYYRLPHAIGVTKVFMKTTMLIGAKLLPDINKLIKLLENPSDFITSIISDKLKENFEFLSPDISKYNYNTINVLKGAAFIKVSNSKFGLNIKSKNNNTEITQIKDDVNLNVNKIPFISSNKNYTKSDITYNYSERIEIKFKDGSIRKLNSGELDNFINLNKNKYDFIYVTENIEILLRDVDKLINSKDDLNLIKAKSRLDEALKLGLDKSTYDSILNSINIKEHPLIKLILGMVTMPIDIIKGILNWLINFFKSLTNPRKLPQQIKEFLSFEWIMQFFKSSMIMEILGIKYDINIKNGNLSDFFSTNFTVTLPTYDKSMLSDLGLKNLNLSKPLLCLVGDIVNAFIDLIWSLFGIEALIKPPHLNLCSGDIIDLLNNSNISVNVSNEVVKKSKEIWEVLKDDGELIQFDNRVDLDYFINNNLNIKFNFIN